MAVVLLLGAAFLAGHVPERRLRVAAEEQARLAQDRLAAAEARVRFGEFLGEVLTVKEVTIRQNYGQAQELSSSFFDCIRAEASETREMAFREALNEILAKRDAVTAASTKADTSVVETLHTMELRLRRALGYSVPPEPAPR